VIAPKIASGFNGAWPDALIFVVALGWVFWRLRLVTVPALIVVVAFALAGCARIEGAGFTNNGRPAPPSCLISKSVINGVKIERWGDCPKGRRQ
jgi:hypothetical protein